MINAELHREYLDRLRALDIEWVTLSESLHSGETFPPYKSHDDDTLISLGLLGEIIELQKRIEMLRRLAESRRKARERAEAASAT